jgi:hypothetical protein
MNVEIGTEAALFPEEEYINGISLQCASLFTVQGVRNMFLFGIETYRAMYDDCPKFTKFFKFSQLFLAKLFCIGSPGIVGMCEGVECYSTPTVKKNCNKAHVRGYTLVYLRNTQVVPSMALLKKLSKNFSNITNSFSSLCQRFFLIIILFVANNHDASRL